MTRWCLQAAAVSRARLATLIPLALCLGAGGVGAAEAEVPAVASAQASHVIDLDFQNAGRVVKYCGWDDLTNSVTFKKEPDFGTHAVLRSALRLGPDTNSSLPFAWDQTAGRIHFDLNRNLDLTDDPAGVFTASRTGVPATFTNVLLMLPTPAGAHPLALDLRLYGYHFDGRLRAALIDVRLRSFWQGKLEWRGRSWQVGLIEKVSPTNRFGEPDALLLRSWEARSEAIDLVQGSPDLVDFPHRLFWRGQAFQVESAWDGDGSSARYRLEFKEQPAALSELRIAGAFVNRVILDDPSGYTAVLDAPGSTARIPPGTYRVSEVWVKAGTNQAVAASTRQIKVDEKSAAALTTGGPLTNSVSLSRSRRVLVAAYRIVGADGEVFRRVPMDLSQPPEITIHHGGKLLDSGRFRFG